MVKRERAKNTRKGFTLEKGIEAIGGFSYKNPMAIVVVVVVGHGLVAW